jgi:ribosome-associated translation inhibitor RaiA
MPWGMKLVIRAHQVAAPSDVSSFLQKHVLRQLQRVYDSPAAQLTISVEDAKPGRGGIDRICKLTYRMPGSGTLRVESVKEDLHAALLECAHRLKRLVQRELQKARSPSRSPQHKPLGRTWRLVASRSETAPDGTPSTL